MTLSHDLKSNTIALVVTLIGATTLIAVIVSLFSHAKNVSEEFFHTFTGLFLIGALIHIGGFFLAPMMRECYVHGRFEILSHWMPKHMADILFD